LLLADDGILDVIVLLIVNKTVNPVPQALHEPLYVLPNAPHKRARYADVERASFLAGQYVCVAGFGHLRGYRFTPDMYIENPILYE